MIEILLIEDDRALAELIRESIPQLGFPAELEHVEDGAEGLKLASSQKYDIILLDISLPTLDGFSICEQLRTMGIKVPLVILTGKDGESERIRGIELGADDYLVKPISIPELIARLRALLRRSKVEKGAKENEVGASEISLGPIRVDLIGRRVWVRGEEISTSRSEFEILQILTGQAGRVFSREYILEQVWGYSSDSYSYILNPHIVRLRKKLELDPANPKILITERGRGYRLATVEELENEDV